MNKKKKLKKCNRECEVYSRVVGFYRPVKNWNLGKKEEYKDRKTYDLKKSLGEDYPEDEEKKKKKSKLSTEKKE